MNIIATLKVITSFFVITTAVLLILIVLGALNSQEVIDVLIDMAAISAIIALTILVLSFLDKTKS